jgi:CD109 antigen
MPTVGATAGPAAPPPTATPGSSEAASSYVATAPRTLRSGGVETVSFALANGDRPATTKVAVALVKDGKAVASGEEWVAGRGGVPLRLPTLAAGDYTLRVSGRGFADEGAVRVEAGTILFLETDKPIYKPGETVRMRVPDARQRPAPGRGDGDGRGGGCEGDQDLSQGRRDRRVGDGHLELPLSTEPNLGVWNCAPPDRRGGAGGREGAQLDIRVERYVLPKYGVKVTLPKGWALVTEPISGTIGAEYSFGKPVRGEATIVAQRYGGTWQEYARLTRPIDGTATFEIPAARYSAGSPGNGGAGRCAWR